MKFPVDNWEHFVDTKKNILKKVRKLQYEARKVEGKRIKGMMLKAYSNSMALR